MTAEKQLPVSLALSKHANIQNNILTVFITSGTEAVSFCFLVGVVYIKSITGAALLSCLLHCIVLIRTPKSIWDFCHPNVIIIAEQGGSDCSGSFS